MENLFQNGSEWLRADFHLHTKADKNEFQYSGADNDFVNDYVNKLIEQNIRIGVITNHNKFDSDEYKALSKKARKENIYILPGVELSVNDGANGVHALIVFDPDDWLVDGNDYINQFITTNFVGKHNFENANGRSNCSLNMTLEQLDKLNKNHFVIMAHVEQNCGLLCEFDGGRIIELGKNPLFRKNVIGFQKVRTYDLINKLNTWLNNKIPCFIEGSDPKSIGEIGKGEACYVKTGNFNFEAIQYALTDFNNRVSSDRPSSNRNSYIKSISFEGGLLKEKKISFSPELNNLIGIRGSGKSSVLEILRFALNIPLGTQAMDRDYKNNLIEYVLKSGGKVIVEIVSREKKKYRIERIYGHRESIFKDDEIQSDITLDAILQQPIYFGQKDLSNKDTDFENDLVNKLVGGKLNDVRSKIETQKQMILRIINELKTLNNLSDIKKETETAQSNAKYKLQMFQEKGVAEKLKIQTTFDSDISKLSDYKANADSFVNELDALIQNYEYLFLKPLQSDINKEIFDDASQQITLLKQEYDKLKSILTDLQQISKNFQSIFLKLSYKKEELKEEFAKIKREINIPELNPDEFIKLNRILEISKLKLFEIEKSETKRKNLSSQLMNELARLDNLWHEKYKILKHEVEKINGISGAKLTVDIDYKARKDKFLTKLQDSFRGYGIRTTAFESIAKEYADFIDMYKDDFRKMNELLNENHLNEFKKQFFLDWFNLLTFEVENNLTVKFEGKPLKEHSLGQRASALILFLLAQKENDILIIDQPEDDLDNQTIYKDVICEIKKLKGEMQFIFATHNANIPVLGDSEMVVACQYADGKEIRVETGSIDCPEIQGKIIQIMEGGKDAFDCRKNIYKIWERSIL